MAASTTVYALTPTLGLDLGAEGTSTPAVPLLTRVVGSDGHDYIYVQANEALGSVDTVVLSASGSASSDSGSGGFTLNVPGGLAAGEYGWAKQTSLA